MDGVSSTSITDCRGGVPRPEMIRGHDPRSRLGDRMFGNILGTLRGQTPEGIETTP
jgi:hypothetical protein